MQINNIKTNRRAKTITTAIVIVVLLLGAALYGYGFLHNKSAAKVTNTSSTPSLQKGTSSTTAPGKVVPNNQYDAPSDGSTNPTAGTGTSGSTSTTQRNSQSVGVSITNAQQYGSDVEVRAYANALENGTCTYTFTHGTSSFTKTTAATAGPSTSSCATLDTPVSEFTSGTWTVNVTYASQSGKFTGTSANQNFSVQ